MDFINFHFALFISVFPRISTLLPRIPTLIPIVLTLIPRISTPIPRIPTLIPRIPTLIPCIPTIAFIPSPDFRRDFRCNLPFPGFNCLSAMIK